MTVPPIMLRCASSVGSVRFANVMLPVRSAFRVSTSTVDGIKIVVPLAVIVRLVVLKDWIFPSISKISSAGSVGGAMFTGVQGACAIAVTEVNTNKQIIMTAGMRRRVIKS